MATAFELSRSGQLDDGPSTAIRREPGSFAEWPRGMGLSLSLRHVGSEQNSSFRRVP